MVSVGRIFLVLLLRLSVVKSVETIDEFLEANSRRVLRHVEDESPIWMEYEFDSGVGNREDLIVKDISIHPHSTLPQVTNWQFFQTNDTSYLFCAKESTLSLYKLNLDNVEIAQNVDLSVQGEVLTFKVINLNSSVVVVLCVKSYNGTSLQWYKLDGDSFESFWLWPVQKHVHDMEFVQKADGNKLLLLVDEEIRFRQHYSTVDVYGFSVDFSNDYFHFWLCQTTSVPKVIDIQVCSIYESVSIALQGKDEISLFEYKGTIFGDTFQELKTIKSHNLNNFACFESGYLQFLAISGPEAGLFHFIEGEFQYNTESEPSFDISDIYWVKDIRLDTYREESLLLLQLQNSTVIALAWQGLSYKRIHLPSNVLDQFNLSTITPVPKFGFFAGNQFVRFHTELKELKHPIQYSTEKLLIVQRLLNDTLYQQEKILDETESRISKSYLKNPVITGFWNISSLNATNTVLSNNVTYHSVSIGSKKLTKEELQFDVKSYTRKLDDLQEKLEEIDSNLKDADLNQLHFNSDIEMFGNLNITGTLTVNDLSVDYINDVNVNDNVKSYETFSSVEAENLTIYSLNGIPVENIRFSDSVFDCSDVNFSAINRAHVTEHLLFETINDVDWKRLMENVVWIDRPAFIPGNTVIEGTLSADIFDVDIVNGLPYPDEYVLTDDRSANITGVKSFNKLTVHHLKNVNTLNDIDFEDFVILNRDNVLKEEITFEDLSVYDQIQIDGEITGWTEENLLLNETSEISNDVTFLSLNILGNVTFDNFFMNQQLFDFRDLLLKTEENVEITGTKTFLSDVRMKSLHITSGLVNERPMDEYVTLDTEQEFPNLVKILPDVTFGNVTFGAIEKLENLFKENSDSCLQKIIVFKSPITVENLTFDKINNVSYEDFHRKLNETDVHFDNLTVENLYADIIIPSSINDVDFSDFIKNYSSNVDEYEVENLQTDFLNASFINGMSINEINEKTNRLLTMLSEIFNGNVTLESLRVTGVINANSINGKSMVDWYNEDQSGNIIFEDGVSIGNLTILGLVNGVNFSEFVSDTVLKTDTNIEVDGHKTFDVVNCGVIETTMLNGRPIEMLFDPSKEQVLTGPVVVNGSITVLNKFNVTGKINDIPFQDLMDRFKLVGDTYVLNGDVHFNDNVTIQNLYTNGSIQGKDFNSFLKDIVFKDEDNVTISGKKVFNSVTFENSITVHDKLNDIDLKRFWEKAVFIDKPFKIKSKIIFKGGILVDGDVTVKQSFETKSIMGIDVDELRHNVLHLNKPAYITEPMTLTNVTFLSNIQVGKINDIDMSLLIPLHTDQAIPVNVLRCRTVNVENVEILGKINGQDLKQVQQTTFMVNGNQNITGHFNFHGHVRMRRDFNAHLNGIDPSRMISLNSKGDLRGNFIFEKPIYLKKSLRTLGYLNGIDPARWEAVAVMKNSPLRQVVSGTWTVRGDVYFQKGAVGSDIVNGTNITEISHVLAKTHAEMDAVLTKEKEKLKTTCEELKRLKYYAENQIYQFNAFDYLQIIEFDNKIVSVHYFELEDRDYMMLSFTTCHMHAYVYTGTKFELIENVPDFGVVERWSTIRHKDILFFLASGPNLCGRGSANLWKLENDTFTHVLDFGQNVNSNRDTFLRMMSNEQMRSVGLNESLSSPDDLKIVFDGDKMLLARKSEIYKYNVDSNDFEKDAKPDVLKFKAGLLQKEMILYYDEEISKDIFIYKISGTKRKVFQTIKTHRPTFFTVINFEGNIETLLIFIENGMYLRIYEYKGIEGFLYRDSIRMDVDKIFTLKIRKYTNVVKRHCLALVHENRLTILEADMHGEKLDMELSCPKV
nr:PREDICTED: uncharacterized protein LOC100883089 [Megachile rotundata]